MNKLLIYFLVLISPGLSFIQAQKYQKGLLWEISGNGLEKSSYLFGTIHSSNKIFFEVSDSVLLAIESTHCFAGELNLDSLQYYILTVSSRGGENPEISEILSKEEYDRLNDLVEEKLGLSIDDFPSKNPAMIAFALERKEYKGDMPYFLDEYLYKIAKGRRKTIQGVETYSDQLNLIDSLTVDEMRQLLLEKLEENENEEKVRNELFDTYQEQDLNKLESLMQREFDDENMEQKFLVQRNYKMTEKIENLIKENSTFIAVGAAHLVTDNGLIELLRQEGYSLRAVQVTHTGLQKKYIDEIIGQPWIVYLPQSGGFSIEMPGETQPFPMSNQIPSVKIESGLYAEVGTQIIYAVMKLIYPLVIDEQRKDSIYNSIIKNLQLSNYKLKEELKDIIYDGLRGKEFAASVGPYTSFSKLFIRENNLYFLQILLPEEELSSENKDRFYNSFKLLDEKNTTNLASEIYTNESGAFRIKFDFEPYCQFINTYDNPVHVFTSSDKLKESTNTILYSDDNSGSFYNDSSEIIYRVRNIATRMNGNIEYLTRYKMEIPCYYFKIASNNTFFSGRMAMRGRRTYVISNSCFPEKYDSIQVDRFLNSFDLIDFQPLSWIKYKDKKDNFIVSLPALPTVKSDSTRYCIKYNQTYASVDSSSGTAYKIYKYSLSEYYQAENDSALYSLFLPNYYDSIEVFVENDTLIDGIKIRERIIKPELTMNYIKSRVFINGNSAYKFEVSAPNELIFSERVSPFFDSIKILEVNNIDVFSDKTELLFNDLESNDLTKSYYAASSCSWFNFKESDRERIYSILKKNFADDSLENGVRASLLNSLRYIEGNSKLDFIKDLYPSMKANPVLKVAALEVVADINTRESTELFLDLILSETPRTNYTYYLFSPFYDSLNNLTALFPRILDLLEYEEYKSGIYGLLAAGIDSTVIQPHQYIEYEQNIIEDCKSFVSMRDSLSDDSEGYNYTWQIIDILKTFPAFKDNSGAMELLKRLSTDIDLEIALQAVVSLLKLGEDADSDTYLRIAGDVQWRNYFYDELSKMSKTNLFPEEYMSQQYFAESDLYNWIYDEDYDVVDTLILIDTLKNEEGVFYLFRFNFDYEPESYFVGVSGPQPLDENLVVSSGRRTKTFYSILQDKSIEEHWEELLKTDN